MRCGVSLSVLSSRCERYGLITRVQTEPVHVVEEGLVAEEVLAEGEEEEEEEVSLTARLDCSRALVAKRSLTDAASHCISRRLWWWWRGLWRRRRGRRWRLRWRRFVGRRRRGRTLERRLYHACVVLMHFCECSFSIFCHCPLISLSYTTV